MKEITISELLEKKKSLEEELNSCISKFEIEVGVKVSSIWDSRTYVKPNVTSRCFDGPNIHVNLGL